MSNSHITHGVIFPERYNVKVVNYRALIIYNKIMPLFVNSFQITYYRVDNTPYRGTSAFVNIRK